MGSDSIGVISAFDFIEVVKVENFLHQKQPKRLFHKSY
jgi:hypothetical protein